MKTIVTHANCVDGYLSALILRACYPSATVVRRKHTDPDLEVTEDTIFCDIAPSRSQAQAFFAAGAVVLDHHRSALDVFREPAARGRYSATPGESGAVLALQHLYEHGEDWVHLADAAEDMATLIGIYDTWVVSNPRFEEAAELHAGLEAVMDDEAITLASLADDHAFYRRLGAVLYGKTKARAKRAAERAIVKEVEVFGRVTSVGVLVDPVSTGVLNLAANLVEAEVVLAASFDSDAVASEAPLVVEELDGQKIRCSIRSRGRVDCAKLAEHFGGGGHRGAAGFSLERGRLHRPVQVAIEALAATLPRGDRQ